MSDLRKWTIAGGYNGARHELFVRQGGPKLDPAGETADVVSVADLRREIDALRRPKPTGHLTPGVREVESAVRYFNSALDAVVERLDLDRGATD